MVNLQISPEYEADINTDLLIKAVEGALVHENQSSDIDLSVVIDNDQTIQQLNLEYREIDAPTDVLSFEADEFDPDEQTKYLGDIIISYDRASVQALAAGHPLINEVQLLVVHGVLHLLGYDHADPVEKAKMWSVQADILNQIGCEINRLPEN